MNLSPISHQEAIDFLYGLQRFGIKLGLRNIQRLLSVLGDPHREMKSIHITGTNGKGSTAAMLESILRRAGYRTGLYTSPHLYRFGERIRVCGERIGDEKVTRFVEMMKPEVEALNCTFFEATTALAMWHFASESVDVAVLEVGMGGRLDATNVVTPLASVITNVSLEHCQHLGADYRTIAEEKAGIIKEGTEVIAGNLVAAALEVIKDHSARKNAPLHMALDEVELQTKELTREGTRFSCTSPEGHYEYLWIPLVGEHQIENALLAIRSAEILREKGIRISEDDIRAGLASVEWPGRFQIVDSNPLTLLDVAHNPAAIYAVRRSIEEVLGVKRTVFVLGVMADKDYRGMIQALAPMAGLIIATQADMERALEAEILGRCIAKEGVEYLIEPSPVEAYELARSIARPGDLVCVTGSHFTVGEIIAKRCARKQTSR